MPSVSSRNTSYASMIVFIGVKYFASTVLLTISVVKGVATKLGAIALTAMLLCDLNVGPRERVRPMSWGT
jgi:hypothetical protein